jgi:O-antigen/teichoic acid export membrane protein
MTFAATKRDALSGPSAVAPLNPQATEPDAPPTPVASIRGATTLASDFGAIASGRILSALLSFVTVLFTTRMLGPTGYGTVAFVGVVSTLVFTVSTAWTGISVRRYGREDLELRGKMNRLTWNRALIGAPLVTVIVSVVLILKIFGVLPGGLTWPLVWIAVGTGLANMVVDHWICLLETSGKMKVSAGGQVLSQMVYVGGLVALFVLSVRISPEVVLLLALGSATLLAIGVAPIVWRVGVMPLTADRQLLRRMLWLSTPVIGLMVSQYIFASVDIFVLSMFRSQHDVGVYAVAYQAYIVLSGVAVSATAVFVPLFVSLQMAGRRSLIERYLRSGVPQGLFLIAAVGGLVVPTVPLLVPIVFGHAFAAAATALSVLAIGLAFLFAAYLVAPILTLHEQTRTTAAINAVAAAINVAGDFLMIGVFHMGIVAPAAATSGALVFIFGAYYVRARNVLHIEVRLHIIVAAPLIAALTPTLLVGGVVGTLSGISGAAATSAAIIVWRSPFTRDDAGLIAKLDLPPIVKRVVLKLHFIVT